ncbi:hypothetical protein R1sor_018114 [Riccia sorocarpa]|uniref:DELLA protein n=1 Tax=Riccia sorocarpa TaxID=122646 RepID=A0ABD3ICU9_9MARC
MGEIDESLYPFAILIDELKNDQIQLRLNSIRRLSTIAWALGVERTRSELIPFLSENCGDEEQVLLAIAEELASFVPHVGGVDFAHVLLPPLETLCIAEKILVRDKAVESLCKIGSQMKEFDMISYFIPLVKRLSAGEWSSARSSACGLFHIAYPRAPDLLRAELISIYKKLCHDDMPAVRRAAGSNLLKFAAMVEPVHLKSEIMSSFKDLTQDDQDPVRLLSTGGCGGLGKLLEPADMFSQDLECGVFPEMIYSWSRKEEDGAEVSSVPDVSGTPSPALLEEPSVSSSTISSPIAARLQDTKCNTPEPRSIQELISPRSTVSNFGFLHNSLDPSSVLDVCDSFLDNEFEKTDSPAHLLPLAEDSSRWEPPSDSGDTLSQEPSQLWMDLFLDDFGLNSAETSLPGLETEGEEARTNSVDTPTSTPSEGHESGASDHKEENEETEEGTAEGLVPPDSEQVTTSQAKKKLPLREIGHELVNLLLACGEAVATKSLSLVNPLFAQLGELASPEGTSIQRIAAFYTEGLALRCSRLWPQNYLPLPTLEQSEEDNLAAFYILNHVCPYVKFSHFTANEIILQAFEDCDRVHVIDFDIKQGLQWPPLFQSLASRHGGPPSHVRVTGIGDCNEDVQDTGDRLAEFADALGLQFEFHAVIDKLEDVRLWMLRVKEKEAVAVNCIFQLHRTLHDKENGIKDLLALIMSTKPKVVAVVEQEASHNGSFFEGRSPRFLKSLPYYAGIFDSLDLNMPADSMARMKVEQFFAQEICNIVACEGPERVERHETFDVWRQHLTDSGFQSVPLSDRAISQAKLLLEMFPCKSYTLTEYAGALTLGWRNQPLFTASAWRPDSTTSETEVKPE